MLCSPNRPCKTFTSRLGCLRTNVFDTPLTPSPGAPLSSAAPAAPRFAIYLIGRVRQVFSRVKPSLRRLRRERGSYGNAARSAPTAPAQRSRRRPGPAANRGGVGCGEGGLVLRSCCRRQRALSTGGPPKPTPSCAQTTRAPLDVPSPLFRMPRRGPDGGVVRGVGTGNDWKHPLELSHARSTQPRAACRLLWP